MTGRNGGQAIGIFRCRVCQQKSPCLFYGRFLLIFKWLFSEIYINILHGFLIHYYARKSKKTDSFMGGEGVPLLHPWPFHVCLQCMTISDLCKQMQNLIDTIYCILSVFLYLSFSLLSVFKRSVCHLWAVWQEIGTHPDLILQCFAHLAHHTQFPNRGWKSVCVAAETFVTGSTAKSTRSLWLEPLCIPLWHRQG